MFNKVYLLGRLSKDVELRNTPNGKSVASCSIATSKTWTDKDSKEKKEKTEFTNLVIWQGAEVFAQYLSKGSKVFIEGELATRNWEDKTTGQKRYATEVIVSDFKFLDNKKEKSEEKSEEIIEGFNGLGGKEVSDEEIQITDIPFN